MKKIVNKIFRKLGYVPYDRDTELLWELLRESVRRNGAMLETDMGVIRVKIAAKSWINL